MRLARFAAFVAVLVAAAPASAADVHVMISGGLNSAFEATPR